MGRILIYRSNCPTVYHIFLPSNDRLGGPDQIRKGSSGNDPAIAMTQLLWVVPVGEAGGAKSSDKPGLGHYGCKQTQGTKLNNLQWHYNPGNLTNTHPHPLLQLWVQRILYYGTLLNICL